MVSLRCWWQNKNWWPLWKVVDDKDRQFCDQLDNWHNFKYCHQNRRSVIENLWSLHFINACHECDCNELVRNCCETTYKSTHGRRSVFMEFVVLMIWSISYDPYSISKFHEILFELKLRTWYCGRPSYRRAYPTDKWGRRRLEGYSANAKRKESEIVIHNLIRWTITSILEFWAHVFGYENLETSSQKGSWRDVVGI